MRLRLSACVAAAVLVACAMHAGDAAAAARRAFTPRFDRIFVNEQQGIRPRPTASALPSDDGAGARGEGSVTPLVALGGLLLAGFALTLALLARRGRT